jgi:cytosine permease
MASNLPDYVASAQPVPQSDRVAWFKSTAQTYAGIMLWFVFWQDVPSGDGMPGGTLAHGLGVAFVGLALAALLCHFLYYLVPGLLGMKTGLPLYIVGTSTYGTIGGFLMPGFLMGMLQFGWLGVNAFFASLLLVAPFHESATAAMLTPAHQIVAVVWAIVAAFVGLKGIKYVASIASFLPLIPFVILVILFIKTAGGLATFDGQATVQSAIAAAEEQTGAAAADPQATTAEDGQAEEAAATDVVAKRAPAKLTPLTTWGVIAAMLVYIIGFFATAGAAGADFGMNNRNASDVHLGGLIGIAGATILAGGLSLLIVAGAYGLNKVDPVGQMQTTGLMQCIMGDKITAIFWYLLAIAAFPPACFSAFIAANSFKTTLPKVNPFISVGIGTAVSIALAVTGWAGDVISVFTVIGASFGPICGAMTADYLLAGKQWAGPRAGFNPAGWISWIFGFTVGAADFIPMLQGLVPVPPLAAFVVGFVLYWLLAKMGLESKSVAMPAPDNS